MATTKRNPNDYIMPLNMNGLRGRMLRLPATRGHNREILFVYGHHASIERVFGLAEVLNDYGTVTVPDLPGFGGMDSFYKIGRKPTLDNLADYLATFVKLRYQRRRLTIVGFSFGFVVASRMLQRYPELEERVDLLISAAGLMHHEDLTFSRPRRFTYRFGASFFSRHLSAIFFRNLFLHPSLLKLIYKRFHKDLHTDEKQQAVDLDIRLWRINDLRTYMDTTVSLLTLDNCSKLLSIPVWHIAIKSDSYFDSHLIEQHMRVVFSDYHVAWAKPKNATTIATTDKKAAKAFIPRPIQALLKQNLAPAA